MGEKDSPSGEKKIGCFFFFFSGPVNLFEVEPAFIKTNEGVEMEVQNKLNVL